MSDATNRHRDVVLSAANVFHDAYGSELVTGPEAHVAVTGNQYWPATLGKELMTVCQNEGHARVFAPSEQSAAMIDNILSCPVKNQTPQGAVPYRSLKPLQTASGGRVVQKPSKPQPRVTFIAGEGTELAWEDDTVLMPFDSDGERAQFTNLPAGVFIARREDGDGDGWVIEDNAGEETARAATTDALDDEYVPVWDWFQPDRLSYRGDIIIHYPDPDAEADLKTYEDEPTQTPSEAHAALEEFLEQFSISAQGTGLNTDEVFDRYTAWLNTADKSKPGRAVFAEALAGLEEIELSRRAPPKGRVLCDRAWRFPPALDR